MTCLHLLKQLIKIPSVFPEEKKLAEYLELFLQKNRFITKRQYINKSRFNLLAQKGGQKKSILLYGHLDTVPDYGRWTKGPFVPWTSHGHLYGRGSVDMKGGIAAMLTAINKIIPRRYSIKIALGVDEENISEGATILNQSDFLKDVVMVLVTETGMSDQINHQLVQQVFGRRGRASYDINVLGKSAHGSIPGQGKNAIEGAAKLILDLTKIKQTENKYLGSSSFFVRDISCQAGSLSIPEQANLRLDWHIVPSQTIKSCLDQLHLFLKQWCQRNDFKIKVRLTPRKTAYLKPYLMDQNNYWSNLATKCISQVLGKIVIPIYGKSVADENIFGQKFPVLVIGPVGGNIHAGNEWVSINSLLMLEKILIKFFKQVFE